MRYLLFVCLILIVMLLTGCATTTQSDGAPAATPDQMPEQEKVVNQEVISEIQLMEKAITDRNTVQCEEIGNAGIKEGCYDRVLKMIAIDAKDMTRCEEITNRGIRTDCKNLINLAQQGSGAGAGTPVGGTDCQQQFTDPAEIVNCENLKIRTLALEQKDPNLCSTISSPEIQDNCKNNVYQNLAIRDKDLTQCGQISIPALVESCENNVYSNKAFADKNAALCDRITNDAMKQSCKSRLA